MRLRLSSLTLLIALSASAPATLAQPALANSIASASTGPGAIGIREEQLTPEFWLQRLAEPDRVVLGQSAIAAQNDRLLRLDPTVHDLRGLPGTLSRAQVAGWIGGLSRRPGKALFDIDGKPVVAATLDALVDNLALDAIPAQQSTRHGLVVQRAALRAFPTALGVFSTPGDIDIDRFQESALFPGTPVVVVHQSRDGQWLFVVSQGYAAWIEKPAIAEGTRAQVFGYVDKTPVRIITGAKERTVYTRESPALSELQLDMGVRLPVLADHPADDPVNGQHPYTAHVVELPLRGGDGGLRFAPALLPRIADSTAGYLPLTHANLVRQGFKFLGERYGWGHAYNGRDCSGFVSEVYLSMGVRMPRNTSAQATSPALSHVEFATSPGGAARAAAVASLQVGDLVYIPGHVMMVIGHLDGKPYVIHDINGGSHLGADGQLHSMRLNGVSVTPLLPLMFNRRERYVDRMTSVVRMRAVVPAEPVLDDGSDKPRADARASP